MKRKLLLLVPFLFAVLLGLTQKSPFTKARTFAKYVAEDDKTFWKPAQAFMYQNQGFPDGHGMYAWPPAMKSFPKKIGLLTFITFDAGFFDTKSKNYGSYLTITKSESASLTAKSTADLSQVLYDLCLPALKKSCRDYGATLLTPEEFANTVELKSAYQQFDFEEKGFSKLFSREAAYNTIACPNGIALYYAESLTMPAYVDAITSKIAALGLDAGLVVKIELGARASGEIVVQSISTALYGPNPVPKQDKKYIAINPATGYHNGVVYNAIKLGTTEGENTLNLLFGVTDKTGSVTEFKDWDKLMGRVNGGMNYTFNQWITGGWKPFKYN